MPIFVYQAKKGPQEVVDGTIEAENKEAAVAKIEQMGYIPIRLNLKGSPAAGGAPPAAARGLGVYFERVSARDLDVFTDQLATLVKSKVPLFDAINILSSQTENPKFKQIITTISGQLKDGMTLSEALSKHPRVFPPLYINMVRSGESGGVLDGTLARLAKFRQEQEEVKANISTALAYPIFITLVGVVSVIILLTFGVPRLVSMFSESKQALPLPTRMLISISSGIRNYWYLGIAFIGLAVFALQQKQVVEKKKVVLDKLALKIPLIGNFNKKAMLAEFTRTFALLLANGVPVLESLQITVPTINNDIFKAELEKVHSDIVVGTSLSQSMKKSSWFPPFLINMIAVGERGGNLQEVLLEVAVFYEREVKKLNKIMTSLLEPAIILVMGLVVGFIVMAMLLPIFEINMAVG
ncbi:MAG: type II secretion system F family protein [Candidatus Omnitrophica bacterium]|nr:type II secretion system F family protein [Candidatus Omnitrophota bacterium]MDD5771731.1 type II secretion system F family protein [Candidatus Omnitrophota bacterium]